MKYEVNFLLLQIPLYTEKIKLSFLYSGFTHCRNYRAKKRRFPSLEVAFFDVFEILHIVVSVNIYIVLKIF